MIAAQGQYPRIGMAFRGEHGAPRLPVQPSATDAVGEVQILPFDSNFAQRMSPTPTTGVRPAATPARPKFFGEGGAGWDIIGGLADGLLLASGQQATFAPQMAQRRRQQLQFQREDLQYQRERADRLADWRMQQQWKVDHPDDQFTRYLVSAGIDPRSPQGQAMYRQRAESMAAPPMMAVHGFDAQGNQTKTFYPRTAFSAGGTAEPAPPLGLTVGTVRNGYRFQGGNPNDRSSWVPVGSASPSGGATFR